MRVHIAKWFVSGSRAFLFFLFCLTTGSAFSQSSVVLSITPSDPYVGDTVKLTATVGGSSPTGTVTFKNGTETLGESALSGSVASINTVFTSYGSKSITVVYNGDANNNPVTSPAKSLSVWKKPTTTTITVNPTTIQAGQPVTVTATVTGNNPTGQVSFWFDPYTTVFATLVNGKATVTAPSVAINSVGRRYVQATYREDAVNAGSDSSRAYYTVQGISLSTSSSSPYVGDAVTLTATIGGNNPTGTVTFMNGAETLGAAPVTSGAATLNTVFGSAGNKSLTAVYSGDANNGSITSPAKSLGVWKKPTTTTITVNPTTIQAGQPVTVTATVTGNNPTGQVSFWFDPYTTVFATLVNGKATVTAPSVAINSVGRRYVQATYREDAVNAGSDSSRAYYTVQGISLSTSSSSPYVGDTVTLTATIGGNNPTGTVTFMNGAETLGAAPVTNGVATLNTVFGSAGNKSLTAVYSGDANNGSITSPAKSLGVWKKPTTTTITVNPTTIQAGQPVTVTATVTGNNPTGQVSFWFDPYTTVFATLVNGKATVTAPSVAINSVGTRYVQATYREDVVNAGSDSSRVYYTVTPQNTLPVVSLSAPSGNASFVAPANIAITASASDPDGTIANVALYQGNILLATLTQPPYSYNWQNVIPGNYTLTAKATDNSGGVTTSAPIAVQVVANQAPSISLSATPSAAIAPATIALAATASDADGTVSKVEFYSGASLLATVTQAPYTFTWTSVGAGSYSLNAKATDNAGAVTTSATATVTVTSSGEQVYFIQADHLNTPRVITDSGNNVVWQWENSDPFGNNVPVASGGFEFNLRFPGQYYDRETNLHYNLNRDYDPSTGRYIQSDPIGLQGGLNTYAYVENNPISKIDPEGLWSISFGMYRGVGWEVIFGRDPVSGNGFMTGRIGFGTGGGVEWDRNGGRPGAQFCEADKGGWGTGIFTDWFSGNIGPLSATLSSNRGINYFSDGSAQKYNDRLNPSWGLGDSWGIKASAAFGSEWTIFTPASSK
jgi:RHS repeat-associated protein